MRLPILTTCLLIAFAAAWGQSPAEPPPDASPDMIEPDMDRPPPEEPGPDMTPPPQHVDRWLEILRTTDSNQYESLKALRTNNPDEFRRALRERLSREKMKSRMHGGQHGKMPPMNPEIMKLEKETMDISRTYRQATDAPQKEQIRKDLRRKLETLFELREQDRQEHIRRIEADLADLKKSVDERQSNREQIIDRRLQELTDGDGLRW